MLSFCWLEKEFFFIQKETGVQNKGQNLNKHYRLHKKRKKARYSERGTFMKKCENVKFLYFNFSLTKKENINITSPRFFLKFLFLLYLVSCSNMNYGLLLNFVPFSMLFLMVYNFLHFE